MALVRDRMRPLTFRHLRHCSVPIVLSTMVFSGVASAQSSYLVLEEVIVTAQKRAQSLQDTALTVNALGAEQLEQAVVFDFNELAKLTAGLELEGNSGVETEIRLRGVGKAATAQGDPSVAVFMDGVVQTQPGAVFGTMLDIARVEVLRGPQGTLWGKNAPTGVINIVTNDPNFEGVDGTIEATVGSWSTNEFRGAINLPLVSDVLALRIAGLYNESNGFVENTFLGEDAQDKERSGGRFKLLYTPSDSLSIKLSGMYADFEGGNTFALVGDGLQTFESQNDLAGFSKDRTESAGVHIDWEFGNHVLSYIGGYQEYARTLTEDRDDSSDPTSTIFISGSSRTVSSELRLASTGGAPLEYMLGIFYQKDRTPGFSSLTPNGGFSVIDIPNLAEQESFGIFSHNTYDFSNHWSLTFGARYSKDSKALMEEDILRLPAFDLEFPFAQPVDDKTNFYNLSGTLKLSYQASDNRMLYVAADTAYRSGGFNPFLTPDFQANGFGFFEEETSTAFEIGMKSRLWEERVQLNVAIYHQEYDDFQVLRNANADVIGFNSATNMTQAVQITGSAPGATSKGVELEVKALLSEAWSIGTSLAYNKVELDQWDDAPCKVAAAAGANDIPGVDFDNRAGFVQGVDAPICSVGGRLGRTPEFTGNISSEYRQTISDTGMDWFIRGHYRYVGDRNAPLLGSYTTLDLSLGLSGGDTWSVVAWGKNVSDEHYLFTTLGESNAGETKGIVGAPDSYGVTAKYNF